MLSDMKRTAGPKDWPEDFAHENGNYNCQCNACGEGFIGHKRRVTCRECVRKIAGQNVGIEMIPIRLPVLRTTDGIVKTLEEWKMFAQRDDCLDRMVPSDLRLILAQISPRNGG